MNTIKKLFFGLFLLTSSLGFAQQEQQLTQFMFHKQFINPAVVGSSGLLNLSATFRTQWAGVEGAPLTQGLFMDIPVLGNKIGLGFNISQYSIGITNKFSFDGQYAYRMKIGDGYLGLGLGLSVRKYEQNFSDQSLYATQSISSDGSIPDDISTKFLINMGAGIFYNSDKFFFGLSIPRVGKNEIGFGNGIDTEFSKEVRHYYLISGYHFKLSEDILVSPQIWLKYIPNTPFDADFNVNVEFKKRLITGISYRLGGSQTKGIGEALSFLVGARITQQILISGSYDLTMSELSSSTSGSYEFGVKFFVEKTKKEEDILSLFQN